MKHVSLLLYLLIPVFATAQDLPTIASVRYSWKTPLHEIARNISATQLFEGSAHDMEYLKMMACDIRTSKKKTDLLVPSDEEHLLIVKRGALHISFGDSSWSLVPGSIALLMPGQKYAIQNRDKQTVLFYRMQYRSRSPVQTAAGPGSFVRDWNKLSFRSHDRGGIRRYFETPTAMCKRFEMHVTTLNAGIKSHEPHTHRAEEIVLVMEDSEEAKNETEMQIGDRFFNGQAGDIYYLGSNTPHAIRNRGAKPCTYFAFQFE